MLDAISSTIVAPTNNAGGENDEKWPENYNLLDSCNTECYRDCSSVKSFIPFDVLLQC